MANSNSLIDKLGIGDENSELHRRRNTEECKSEHSSPEEKLSMSSVMCSWIIRGSNCALLYHLLSSLAKNHS